MKFPLTLFIFLLFATPYLGASITNVQSTKTDIRWKKYSSENSSSASDLANNKSLLKLDNNSQLIEQKLDVDQFGIKHYSYQQSYKGIPIESAVYKIHEKNNKAYSSNGTIISGIDLPAEPVLTEQEALTIALNKTNALQYAWEQEQVEQVLKHTSNKQNASFYPEAELVIYNPKHDTIASNYRLTYKFDIYSLEPLSRKNIYIDALTGEYVGEEEKIKCCFQEVNAGGLTSYSNNIDFTACQLNDPAVDPVNQYQLKSELGGGIQVFNSENGIGFPYNTFESNSSFFDDDPTATQVFYATQNAYQYFKWGYNRDGIDDNNSPMYSWVHYSNNFSNAFWNGNWMTYGDGNDDTYAFTSSDIVGHEITHGIIDHTAALAYQGESGALSEGFADIFGKRVEYKMHFDVTDFNWIFGEVFKPGANNEGLRDMSNPKNPNMANQQPDTYLGEYWYTGDEDNGGVHTNSGVLNYWFYLLCEGGSGTNDNGYSYNVSPIFIQVADAIAYRALTVYLTPNAQYQDVYAATLQAAIDLHGASSNQYNQVEAAWCAVGIGNCATYDCRTTDSLTLVSFYNYLDGDLWTNQWDLNQSMDQWHGITLNENGCVKAIELENNNLTGFLPTQIENLSNLEILNLGNNNLNGFLYPSFSSIERLKVINLDSNSLVATIPANLAEFDSLVTLDLSNNQIYGVLPNNLSNLANIEHINVSNNLLTGSIPNDFYNSNLIELDISNNQFTGVIPASFSNFSNLEFLNVSNNSLNGCYNSNLSNLCNTLLPANNVNAYISDNNNFTSSWENFCNLNEEVCNCRYTDSLALLQLNNTTFGANWATTWDLSQPIDTWHGITLNANGCVTNINLESNQLVGYIPQEIGSLESLVELDLSDNEIHDNIPKEIGDLFYLQRLDLSNNFIDSAIPYELGNNINLNELILNDNNLTYDLPTDLGNLQSLVKLNLSSNNFYYPLICELGELNNLTELIVTDCNIPGEIPSELAQLDALQTLDLSRNQLVGNIPNSFGNFQNLKDLFLIDNNLTGTIPAELANVGSLETLVLANNNFSGCYHPDLLVLCDQLITQYISVGNNFDAAWGSFCNSGQGSCIATPCTDDYSNLIAIYNSLDGDNWNQSWDINQPISTWQGVTTNSMGCVISISLANNNLVGELPTEIGDFAFLTHLDLSSNQIIGDIPASIGNLNSLDYLNISSNNLTGDIPIEIGQLNNLIELNLAQNSISGTLPIELSALNNLEILNLSLNSISGQIPYQFGLLQNLNSLELAWNSLDGSIPPQIGSLSNLEYLVIANNNLSGCYPNQLSSLCNSLLTNNNLNFLISAGNNFDESWNTFCNTGISCPNMVWPGDFDNDGHVTATDVLYWGYAEGETDVAFARNNPTTNWVGQDAPEWNIGVSGVNTKHQDADGNGTIDILDLQVLEQNFGLTHSNGLPLEYDSPFSFELNVVDFVTANGQTTATYEISIVTESGLVPNIHGAAFTLDFHDTQVYNVTTQFGQSDLVPDETIDIYDSANNQLHISTTRTDGINVPIYEPVAIVIIITEDLQSGDPFLVSFNDGNSMVGTDNVDQTNNGLITRINNLTIDSEDDVFSPFGICSSIPSDSIEITAMTSTAFVSWPENLNAENYIIEYREAGDLTWQNSYAADYNFTMLNNIEGCTTYELQIRSICTSLNSNFSDIITFESSLVIDTDADGICDVNDCNPYNPNVSALDDCGVCGGNGQATTNWQQTWLTHTGAGSNSTTLVFPTMVEGITFTISGINNVISTGNDASNNYIEKVTFSYVNQYGFTTTFSPISYVTSYTYTVPETIQSLTVKLEDGESDGTSGINEMGIALGDVSYCGTIPVCDDFYYLQNIVADNIYEVSDSIKSIGVIPAAGDVKFEAGINISLEPGFEVKQNATFEAIIEDCQ